MKKLLRSWAIFIRETIAQFLTEGTMYQAGTLTFTSLLAIVPLMAVFLSMLSAFPVFHDMSDTIQKFIFSNFLATSSEVIHQHLQSFVNQVSKLSIQGIVLLVVTAIMMMMSIESAFNRIWHLPRRRRGASAFLLYWSVLTLAPLLVGASLVLTSYFASLKFVNAHKQLLFMTRMMLDMLPFVLSGAAFSFLYIVIPNCVVPVRFGLVGGVVAAILFECAKRGFAFYLARFPTYELIYGTLAAIPIFIIWVYFCWLITLYGCQVSYGVAIGFSYRHGKSLEPFMHAFRWLGYFWEASQEGKGLSLVELVRRDKCRYDVDPEDQLTTLIRAGLLNQTARGRYVLSRDLSNYTLMDLHKALRWRLPVDNVSNAKNMYDRAYFSTEATVNRLLEKHLSVPLAALYQKVQ